MATLRGGIMDDDPHGEAFSRDFDRNKESAAAPGRATIGFAGNVGAGQTSLNQTNYDETDLGFTVTATAGNVIVVGVSICSGVSAGGSGDPDSVTIDTGGAGALALTKAAGVQQNAASGERNVSVWYGVVPAGGWSAVGFDVVPNAAAAGTRCNVIMDEFSGVDVTTPIQVGNTTTTAPGTTATSTTVTMGALENAANVVYAHCGVDLNPATLVAGDSETTTSAEVGAGSPNHSSRSHFKVNDGTPVFGHSSGYGALVAIELTSATT